MVITCTYDLFRSLPYSSAVSFLVAFVGACVSISQRYEVDSVLLELLPFLKVYTAALFLKCFWLLYIITFLVDASALLASFCASGKTRECCFGRRDNWCCLLPQFLASQLYLLLCL